MKQVTYAMIKPHAVKAGLTGKVIDRIEHEGFTIVALKKFQMTRELAEQFYGVHRQRPFFPELVETIASGPVVGMVLEKDGAIAVWREIMGATDPAKAAPGTLRKLYAPSISENVVHGSDAPETAQSEIALIFPELK
jgi:Nucleoside diphosphate kinase